MSRAVQVAGDATLDIGLPSAKDTGMDGWLSTEFFSIGISGFVKDVLALLGVNDVMAFEN